MNEENKKEEIVRQDWKPHWSIDTLYKIWRVIYGGIKIAIGAAATVLLILVVCAFVLVGILGDYLDNEILPSATLVLENYNMDAPSYVYFVNSQGNIEELQKVHATTDFAHADYEDIPEALVHAAVAIEDKRFYEHQGVDWFTTIKAFANMFLGDATVGGSTITQQLIKNRTQDDSVTIQRKVLEFFRATLVEKNYDKKEIMEYYLNSIYLGQGCRGVKSAAETYFGKELQTLTIAECASLISITNNPSMFDPYSDNEFEYAGEMMNGFQRNQYRQRLVLGEMLSQGYISQEEYDAAIAQELVLKNGIDEKDRWIDCENEACEYESVAKNFTLNSAKTGYVCPKCSQTTMIAQSNSQVVYSYFVDTVLEDVAKALAEKDGVTGWNSDIRKDYMNQISSGGYRIYSTYDEKAQKAVDNVYQNLNNIPAPGGKRIQSAIVLIDNATGDIVAMAGGVGKNKEHFGLNRATQSKLQSGSSIKPLSVYAPGFQQGTLTPATVIKDLPLSYSGGAWPKNDNRVYNYSHTIYSGVTKSVNAVAANALVKIGESYGFEFAKESFGLSTLDKDDDLSVASLALGAQHNGVYVRDMSNAFATFANNGVYREGRTFTKVYDMNGNLVLDNVQEARQILSEKANTYMTYCLVNAANAGTGTGAKFSGQQIAGKTGTTSSMRDRWFCGYTKYYTAAVWTGYDRPAVINLNYNPACRLWKQVMQPLHKGLTQKSLYSTSGMVKVSVCLDSGKIATSACSSDIRGSRVSTAYVYPEDKPSGSCNKHVTKTLCSVSNDIANDYCKKFAEAGADVKVQSRSLVNLTQAEINAIRKASGKGLSGTYTSLNYLNSNDPCKVHTATSWAEYLKQQVTNPPTTPTTPTTPATP